MKFNSMMHVSFFTDQMEEIRDFYENKLGCKAIFRTKEELMAAGIAIDSDILKGPSETYQLWIQDPDGNKIEIMQYTENSLQVKGNC